MKNEMTVFELCRKDTKISTRELFAWFGLDSKLGEHTDLGDCYLRLIGDGNIVEFSEPKKSFDRWGNSTLCTLDLKIRSQRRRFISMMELELLQ